MSGATYRTWRAGDPEPADARFAWDRDADLWLRLPDGWFPAHGGDPEPSSWERVLFWAPLTDRPPFPTDGGDPDRGLPAEPPRAGLTDSDYRGLEVALRRQLDGYDADGHDGLGPVPHLTAALRAVLDLALPPPELEDAGDRELLFDGWETCRNQALYAVGEALGVHRP